MMKKESWNRCTTMTARWFTYFPGTEIVSQRIKPADYKGNHPYECYDREGKRNRKGGNGTAMTISLP